MKGMNRWLAAVVLIGGLGMVACEEDPVGSGGHEEGDVASFRIREAGGAVLY